MDRLSGFVLRHKALVALLWLVVTAAGVFAATEVTDRLEEGFAPPGSQARDANQAIVDSYGTGGDTAPQVPVITLPEGQAAADPAATAAIGRAFATVEDELGARTVSFADTGDERLIGADGRTTFGLVYAPLTPGEDEAPDLSEPAAEILRDALPAGSTVQVTGMELLESEGEGEGVSVLAEVVIGGLGALIVLAFVFGSLLAFVPLMIAIVSICSSFLFVYGMTEVIEVSFMVQFVVALIGLGVAIDYSLLLVTRWREEKARGHEGEEAIRRAMATAGRSVIFSGAAVAIGLTAMVVLPVPFLRSIAYGGIIIALISVLATLTLLPIILAVAGRRLDWPGLRRGAGPSRPWTAWARLVIRFKVPAAIAAFAVLGALSAAALTINLGEADSSALAKSGPAYEGLSDLRDNGIPSGTLTPVDILVPPGTDPASVADRLGSVEGVHAALAPEGDAWQQGGTSLVTVVPQDEGGTSAGKDTVSRLRDEVPAGTQVGGEAAGDIDFIEQVYGAFPLILLLIGLVTFVLLARAFRSLLLPLKAVLLNLLSLGAVMGAVVLIWQEGYGSEAIWGISATGSIGAFVPALIFAFLYGLSMDYEVFILARMKEAHDRTGSTEEAVVEGLGRTGRLVTSAALILCLAFISLAAAPITEVKMFATGLAVGILLDATIVRGILVPAMVVLFGKWNWWLPDWAAKVLRVPPSSVSPRAEQERQELTPIG
jgi:RND superfamily putative drug exporter